MDEIVESVESVESAELVNLVKIVELDWIGFLDERKLPKRVRKLLGKSVQAPVLAEINYHGWVGGWVGGWGVGVAGCQVQVMVMLES